MITLEKIQSPLFSKLYEAFLHDDDALSNERDWRHVFDYQWDTDEGHCGYAMMADGDVVGMMGMVFSDRHVNGKLRKFCNLHTWWVREDYRGRSLSMLRPVQQLQGYTITHFTPCDTIRGLTKRMGFRELSKQVRILLPRFLGRGRSGSENSRLCYDPQEIEDTLTERDKKIYLDHQPYGCGHLLIRGENEYCYLLFTRVVRHWMPYCHIHYISNKEVFARHEPAVRCSLLKTQRARYVAVDIRLVNGMKFPASFRCWEPPYGVYKSSDLGPAQIDNLYSDIVFLNLTVHPDASKELRILARRLWPFSRN